ncbi:MAG: hypothetical protein KF819_23005 [Labilithrix sp.]|nr:hypothetical protein [Labilithrix sp.]
MLAGVWAMSFELPRRPVSLRFTGEVKSLGKERPKSPPPLPGRSVPASPAPPPPVDVYIQEAPTPYVGSRPSERAERVAASAIPVEDGAVTPVATRPRLASFDDDVQTLAFDRDDVGLGPPKSRGPGPNLPVPGFRSADQVARNEPTVVVRAQPERTASLTFVGWLCVAFIAATLSYHFAPEARSGIEEAVRVLAGR